MIRVGLEEFLTTGMTRITITITSDMTLKNQEVIKVAPYYRDNFVAIRQSLGDYDTTAMMTMDGLLRPVSKSGEGNLPAMKTYTSVFCPSTGIAISEATGRTPVSYTHLTLPTNREV